MAPLSVEVMSSVWEVNEVTPDAVTVSWWPDTEIFSTRLTLALPAFRVVV